MQIENLRGYIEPQMKQNDRHPINIRNLWEQRKAEWLQINANIIHSIIHSNTRCILAVFRGKGGPIKY